MLILGGELESGELLAAAGAGETLLVPGIALVGDPSAPNDLGTLAATLSVLGLVAGHTNYLVLAGDKALGADGLSALHANKAFLMPLLSAVLVFAHARLENALATVTTRREALVVAVGAVELILFGGEGPVCKRSAAGRALEALFVPVALLEGEVLCGTKGDVLPPPTNHLKST